MEGFDFHSFPGEALTIYDILEKTSGNLDCLPDLNDGYPSGQQYSHCKMPDNVQVISPQFSLDTQAMDQK